MKKLLIAAAVAVLGIAANAAALNWLTYGYINDDLRDCRRPHGQGRLNR